jgi:hypothetical protein
MDRSYKRVKQAPDDAESSKNRHATMIGLGTDEQPVPQDCGADEREIQHLRPSRRRT